MAMSIRTRTELFFSSRLKREPDGVTFAPGRVVVLGEHLDHQGGRVLARPLREGVAVAYAVRPDTRIAIWALNAKAKDLFPSDQLVRTGRSWSDLAKGACARVAARGNRVPGLDLVVFGDLQTGEGLGSSAAYLTALLQALFAAADIESTPASIAADVMEIEKEWLGVPCGPLDPYVAALGRHDELVLLDCADLSHETHALPDGLELATVSTGIRRALGKTPYAERCKELESARAALLASGESEGGWPAFPVDDFEDAAAALPFAVRARARHVVTESARVTDALSALEAADGEALGTLLDASHTSLAHDFESSTPEIDELVKTEREKDGVLGVRLQGAGWGGQLVVLRTSS